MSDIRLSATNNSIAQGNADDDRVHSDVIRGLIDGERKSDAWLIRASDWSSPILVKELRQALKSRQFNWTLAFLLLFIAAWTIFAIVSLMPGIYFFPSGATLLGGYFALLLIPTILIVPNAAYRSMASELEQGTFDVLCITPLSPFKIVIGKLTVAMVQSIIYFSALAPCITMCYLLRGLPLFAIANILTWVFVVSLLMSAIGVLLATGNRYGAFGTLLSIVMIGFSLFAMFCLYGIFASSMMWGVGSSWSYEAIWASAIGWSFVLAYTFLVCLVASAAIGVAGENYSTRIRWCLLGISWMTVVLLSIGIAIFEIPAEVGAINQPNARKEIFAMLVSVLAIHWGIAGTFLIAERGVTSPRAQRSLPNTLLGRMFLTWLNPGGGTGYVFTLLSFAGTIGGFGLGFTLRFVQSIDAIVIAFLGAVVFCYLVFYLGLTRIVLVMVGMIPGVTASRMLFAPLLTVLWVLLGTFLPLFVSGIINGDGQPQYEWYTIFNPFWTIGTLDNSFNSSASGIGFVALMICSIVVFSINFATLSRDITLVRIEAPPRVLQERSHRSSASEHTPPVDVSPFE